MPHNICNVAFKLFAIPKTLLSKVHKVNLSRFYIKSRKVFRMIFILYIKYWSESPLSANTWMYICGVLPVFTASSSSSPSLVPSCSSISGSFLPPSPSPSSSKLRACDAIWPSLCKRRKFAATAISLSCKTVAVGAGVCEFTSQSERQKHFFTCEPWTFISAPPCNICSALTVSSLLNNNNEF